ncbi:hypothetical protein KVH24_05220 [Streptomyces olivaceus]|uniref:hypothetical protein n=1 Tax=Streptomyces olivaceus TaxID=47716 RepID=UPI001CCC44BC|nr:hypothetical protein [Streptomyces olivaceus]MBZ6171445.1 hypothetical protein [Streptomyces olivaceus]MBZ6178413.1 hypothetical protein [Streptomyces olivaceus]
MPNPDRGGLSAIDTHLLQTLACGTDSGNKRMIALLVVLTCVINGDTMTSVLRQTTWLVVAVIILIVVQAISLHLPQPRVKPDLAPDISG